MNVRGAAATARGTAKGGVRRCWEAAFAYEKPEKVVSGDVRAWAALGGYSVCRLRLNAPAIGRSWRPKGRKHSSLLA